MRQKQGKECRIILRALAVPSGPFIESVFTLSTQMSVQVCILSRKEMHSPLQIAARLSGEAY